MRMAQSNRAKGASQIATIVVLLVVAVVVVVVVAVVVIAVIAVLVVAVVIAAVPTCQHVTGRRGVDRNEFDGGVFES